MSTAACELQQLAINLVNSLPQEKFEHIDEVLQRVSCIEESLDNVAKTVSIDRFQELAKGKPSEVQGQFECADPVLERLASDLLEARKVMERAEGGDGVM